MPIATRDFVDLASVPDDRMENDVQPAAAAIDDAPNIDIIRRNLALANRILAKHEIVDTFGHVSQRSPWREDRFFIASSMAPDRVTPADIWEYDLDGNAVIAGAPPSYLERFIHSEIYRAKPGVQSVIHSHSSALLPFSVVRDVPLRCVCHTSGFVGQHVPVFEIRDHEGDESDLLIRTPRLGVALAECLGDNTLVLMRGHGSTATGGSLPQAVYHAIYAEVNARVQFQSMLLGAVTYLSVGEAKVATSSPEAIRRSWDLWVSQVQADLA